MKLSKQSSALVIGMALFAMFFGSGNLIYPLFIGRTAEGGWTTAAMGFLSAAVFLPFLGVVAMVLYEGCYATFFRCLGRRGGLLLSAILLTVWIPLGSAPRCISLSHASLTSYTSAAPPLWIFSLAYSGLVYLGIRKASWVLDLLGKIVTPLLLLCIGIVFYQGMQIGEWPAASSGGEESLLWLGLREGYNTMDLIASFFFSATIIHLLTQSGGSMRSSVGLVFRGGMVGMVILSVVYVCLISISAKHAGLLVDVPKDQALAYLTQQLMGERWSVIAILTIMLACVSTSMALIIAYADFLREELFTNSKEGRRAMFLALSIAYVMSLFGLDGITAVTAPVLRVCYPILLVLIIVNVSRKLRKHFADRAAVDETSLDGE